LISIDVARGLSTGPDGERLGADNHARPCVGVFKSPFPRDLVIFGDKFPPNGSKNDPMVPRTTLECPHEGPGVEKLSADWYRHRQGVLEYHDLKDLTQQKPKVRQTKAWFWEGTL